MHREAVQSGGPPVRDGSGGPIVVRESTAGRLLAAMVGLGCLALLVTAAWLRPDSDGHGTHTQLGLPPCGWMLKYGRPCPTCGMTTSFAHAAEGHLGESFVTQPFGMLLAVLTAACVFAAGHIAITGSTIGRHAATLLRPPMLITGGVLLLAAWGYKLWITEPGAPLHLH
ncbi:MAG: DUF2752 domain-containing protein [Planctomycetota bacterium]